VHAQVRFSRHVKPALRPRLTVTRAVAGVR
jgi:hypothetical protein